MATAARDGGTPMRVTGLSLRPGAVQEWRVVLVASCVFVVSSYFYVKFTLFAAEFLVLIWSITGVSIGLSHDRRRRSFVSAARASTVAILSLLVVFVLDAVRITSTFDVTPPLVGRDPGLPLVRLLVFGTSEAIVVTAVGSVMIVVALLGAWIGSSLRPVVDDVGGTR